MTENSRSSLVTTVAVNRDTPYISDIKTIGDLKTIGGSQENREEKEMAGAEKTEFRPGLVGARGKSPIGT